jgi:hypothetical protein
MISTREWSVLPQTRKDAWWLWTGLSSEIKWQCEMLIDSEHFERSLPLPPRAVLSYAQPWHERIMIALRCDSDDYMMNVVFDPDLLAVRYAVDHDPHTHELLVVRRRNQSRLLRCDGTLLTGDEAAKSIVVTLTGRS